MFRKGPVKIENRIHNYTVVKEEQNPQYEVLRRLLDVAADNLTRLRIEFSRNCTVCAGTGFITCQACGGTGQRNGTPCPRCNVPGGRPGWVKCPRCDGLGHGSRLAEWNLRQQELEVISLQARLNREPQTVLRQFPAAWPYVVEHHEKTGTFDVVLQVVNTATGKAIYQDTVRGSQRSEDATIQNPNPAVGLQPDPLKLPTDDQISQMLLDNAADEITTRVLTEVVVARSER